MKSYLLRPPPFQGAYAANGEVRTSLARRHMIRRIFLYCETAAGVANTEAERVADIRDVSLLVDGKPIIDSLPQRQVEDLGDFWRGRFGSTPANDGYVVLNLARPWMELEDSIAEGADGKPKLIETSGESLGFGTKGVSSVVLRIRFTAAWADVDNIRVVVEYLPIEAEPGLFVSVSRISQEFGSTGFHDVRGFGYYQGQKLLAAHVTGYGAGVCDGFSVRQSQQEEFEVDQPFLNRLLSEQGWNPIANYYHLVPSLDLRLTSLVPLIRDVTRIRTSWSTAPGAGVYDVYAETVQDWAKF